MRQEEVYDSGEADGCGIVQGREAVVLGGVRIDTCRVYEDLGNLAVAALIEPDSLRLYNRPHLE